MYALFEHTAVGRIFLEATNSLDNARVRMRKLAAVRKIEVVLYDVSRGTFIETWPC